MNVVGVDALAKRAIQKPLLSKKKSPVSWRSIRKIFPNILANRNTVDLYLLQVQTI
jgi:hypothetical protein